MEQALLQVTVHFNQLAIFMELCTKVTPPNSIPFMIPKPHDTLITKYAAFNKGNRRQLHPNITGEDFTVVYLKIPVFWDELLCN